MTTAKKDHSNPGSIPAEQLHAIMEAGNINRFIGRLAARSQLNHAYKNVLAITHGYSHRLQTLIANVDAEAMDPKAREASDRVMHSLNRLMAEIKDRRLELPFPDTPGQVVDLGPWLATWLRHYGGLAAEVPCLLDLPSQPLQVRGPAWALSGCLFGIVENAREAAASKEQARVQIELATKNNMLEMSVTDNGEGFDQSVVVEDPMLQTKGSTKGPWRLGLGLDASQYLARLAHGSIIRNENGYQNTVVIRWPLAQPST